jgi:hypothetical protein
MTEKHTWTDRDSYAVGGTTMIGLGTGFFFLQRSPLLFAGCLLIGIGAGLVVAALISRG